MQTRQGPAARCDTVLAALTAIAIGIAAPAAAQGTAAAGQAASDDTPSVRIGGLLFADYTYQQKPETRDADGNLVQANSFNVSRSYLNVTGNLSRLVAFRITPDVARETGTGSSLNGSMTFRIKYAFAQLNLDQWMPKGTFVRFGIQQTPFIDSLEPIYRYRFQGSTITEREGYLSSSDAGVSFRTTFAGDYGDVHVGVYNGEGYARAEANNQKAIQARVGVRPLARHPLLRGWRVQAFYDGDHVVRNAARRRVILDTTFEYKYANGGFDLIDTRDQASALPPSNAALDGRAWSIWATPRLPNEKSGASWEALLRYDHTRPDRSAGGVNKRAIAGVAYWFPRRGPVASAILFDVENVSFPGYATPKPAQRRFFAHAMVSF